MRGGLGLIPILRWRLVPVLRWWGTSLVLLLRRGVLLLLLLWRILHKSVLRSALQAATALLRSSSEARQADPAVAWLNGRSVACGWQSYREFSDQPSSLDSSCRASSCSRPYTACGVWPEPACCTHMCGKASPAGGPAAAVAARPGGGNTVGAGGSCAGWPQEQEQGC